MGYSVWSGERKRRLQHVARNSDRGDVGQSDDGFGVDLGGSGSGVRGTEPARDRPQLDVAIHRARVRSVPVSGVSAGLGFGPGSDASEPGRRTRNLRIHARLSVRVREPVSRRHRSQSVRTVPRDAGPSVGRSRRPNDRRTDRLVCRLSVHASRGRTHRRIVRDSRTRIGPDRGRRVRALVSALDGRRRPDRDRRKQRAVRRVPDDDGRGRRRLRHREQRRGPGDVDGRRRAVERRSELAFGPTARLPPRRGRRVRAGGARATADAVRPRVGRPAGTVRGRRARARNRVRSDEPVR